MPANNRTHFSKSQVRTRLRSAIRPYSQRGGISLRVLSPLNFSPPVPRDHSTTSDFQEAYASFCAHAMSNVNLISQLTEDSFYLAHNRLWHIAIVKGNELTQATVVTVHIGSDTEAPVVIAGFGEGWLQRDCVIIPDVLTTRALDMEQALLRTQSRNARRNQSSSLSPSDSEEDDI